MNCVLSWEYVDMYCQKIKGWVPRIPSRTMFLYDIFEPRLAENNIPLGEKVMVMCSALKWRIAIVAKQSAPTAEPAKV